ncbi:related to CCAAT-binding factor HAPB protein [Serendipita indica DSM 11827]|uniref:Transcriptional activator HAP2 n=1 Tax=Serendipita indica (strain DSM 11827) TaxID=1109443 RepID=G4T4X7_SERID|nr:related to CCAAT-binding factor HAPB protein [Serendipita indica DSM 11827]
MQNVPHIPQATSHHRRDSSVSIGLEHAPSQVSFGHQPQSPPLRQPQQAQQQQQQQASHHHHQHQPSMSSRPRSTSAATVELSGAGSSSMMHDSRPRAHSYADPRAAADQRNKQHSQTAGVDDVGFGSTNAVQELDEEPLYVNAKQYHRILKRRAARARLAEIQKLSSQRKPYLHQSRHNHAIRRPRGPGGRFLTAEEIAARKAQSQNEQNGGDDDGGLNESPISPTQESVSSPQDDIASPLSPTGDKSSNSLAATASAVFGYSTNSADVKTAGENGGGVNGLTFDADGLSSILESPGELALGGNYNFGSGEQ